MKTISISLSDFEYNQLGIENDKLSFTEFVDLVNKEISKQMLNKCVQLSEKYKLSTLTMDEISEEVKAVRNAKNNHWYKCVGISIDTKKLPKFYHLPLRSGKSGGGMYIFRILSQALVIVVQLAPIEHNCILIY